MANTFLLLARSMGLGLASCALLSSPVVAQAAEEQDIERLQRELKVLTEEMRERIGALEDLQAPGHREADDHEWRKSAAAETQEHLDALFIELIEDRQQLEQRLDLMPDLSGYFDVEYRNDNKSGSPGTFNQHHLSLHIVKELDEFRFFSETEFEYGTKYKGSGGAHTEQARGEIKVEQAWGEWTSSDLLTLRAGLILTPGYWNVNHYPNVVLSTRRPLMVRKIFRESFTGLMAHGTHYWRDFGATWSAYAGNGRSDYYTKQDDNEGKALGGRFTMHLPAGEHFDTLDIGMSSYGEDPASQVSTRTWGVDAQIRVCAFELLCEYANRSAAEDRDGFYAQPSWRLDDSWALFYRADHLNIDGGDRAREHTVGVNFRPIPDVSLKAEVYRSDHSAGEDFEALAVSLAMAF